MSGFFLRHQAGAGGKGIAELDEPKFGRAQDDQVFAETGKMNPDHGQAVKDIGDKIAVTNRVDAVLRDAFKSKSFCDGFAIECDA
jgi:hypothetical protein